MENSLGGGVPPRLDRVNLSVKITWKKTNCSVSARTMGNNGSLMLFDSRFHSIVESKIIATLNNGSLKQIMALPTIGKKRAQCIIEYRESNGNFSSVGFISLIIFCCF